MVISKNMNKNINSREKNPFKKSLQKNNDTYSTISDFFPHRYSMYFVHGVCTLVIQKEPTVSLSMMKIPSCLDMCAVQVPALFENARQMELNRGSKSPEQWCLFFISIRMLFTNSTLFLAHTQQNTDYSSLSCGFS